MAIKKRKILVWVTVSLIILAAIRISLPYGVKWYLNHRVLNKMEKYKGSVKDVDIALWKGAYAIDSLIIVKLDSDIEQPFVEVARIDLSIQWKALFNGEVVGEVSFYSPNIHFAFSKDEDKAQTGSGEDWVQVVKNLIPIRINRFAMINGKLALTNLIAQPQTDLPIENFNLEIHNIQNVYETSEDALPSSIVANGTASGYKGKLNFTAEAMLLKKIPDFNYNLSFEHVALTSLNPLMKHYSGMDFEKGEISIYSEMAMKDSAFKGYVKPLIKDMRIFNWKEEDRKFLQGVKEFFSEGIQEIFENQSKQQFATRIPIEGAIDDVDTDIWLTIVNALRNAYVDAFKYELDGSIDFEDLE